MCVACSIWILMASQWKQEESLIDMLGIMQAAHFSGCALCLLKVTVRMCLVCDNCSAKYRNIETFLFRSLIRWRNDGHHRREQKEKDADNEVLSLCLYQLNPNHTMVVLNK